MTNGGKGQMVQPAASVIDGHLVAYQQGTDQAEPGQQQEYRHGRVVLGATKRVVVMSIISLRAGNSSMAA